MSYYTAATPLSVTGRTGNNTEAAVNSDPDSRMSCFQFVVEAIGATPTVTFKIQGTMNLGSVVATDWVDIPYITTASDTAAVAGITVTAVGVTPIWLANCDARFFRQYRLVTSANTNVTYRGEMYEVSGSDT